MTYLIYNACVLQALSFWAYISGSSTFCNSHILSASCHHKEKQKKWSGHMTSKTERLSTVPWCFILSFITLSFHLQITYRKVRNLRIGVDKLVGKLLINLFITSCKVSCLHNQHNYQCACCCTCLLMPIIIVVKLLKRYK